MKYLVSLRGKTYEIEVERGEAALIRVTDSPAPTSSPASPPPPAQTADASPASPPSVPGEPVAAPLSGSIVSIKKQAGQSVKKGDLLVIIEAMKMENEVFSPFSGTVSQIPVTEGTGVNIGDPLLYLVKEGDS